MKTNNLTLLLSLRATGHIVAFESGEKKPGWKIDADGKIELRDGNPVYIDNSGNEVTLSHDTVSRLNGEAKGHREAKEAAEAQLKKYKPLIDANIDPAAAITALETVKDIKDGDLIKKGEVDRVRNEISAQFQKDIDDAKAENGTLRSQLSNLHLGSAFENSKWIKDNVAIPVDMLRKNFGESFKYENNEIHAIDAQGNRMLSRKKGGEYADFDEAISIIVEGYQYKDSILKGNNHSGTGNGGGGNGGGGSRIMRRSEFDALSPQKKQEAATAMNKGELTIAD